MEVVSELVGRAVGSAKVGADDGVLIDLFVGVNTSQLLFLMLGQRISQCSMRALINSFRLILHVNCPFP